MLLMGVGLLLYYSYCSNSKSKINPIKPPIAVIVNTLFDGKSCLVKERNI